MPFPIPGQTIYGGWTQEGEQYADLKTRFSSYNTKSAGLVGDSVADDFAALNLLLNTTMQPNGGRLDIVGVPRVASDLAVPSNVRLKFVDGAFIAPDVGKTVTINGKITYGMAKIFGGGGSVVFGAGAPVSKARPEWWGALGNGVANDSAAIRAANNSGCRLIQFRPASGGINGTYGFTGDLSPAPGVEWGGIGKRQYATALKALDATGRVLFLDSCEFHNFYIYGLGLAGAYTGTGMQVGNVTFAGHVVTRNVLCSNFQVGLRLAAALWFTAYNCQWELNRTNIDFNAGAANLYSTTTEFYSCTSIGAERNGIGGSFVPITNQRFIWIGGSVEQNCSTDAVTYAQVSMGSVGYFQFDAYMEGVLVGGVYPVAINAAGMEEGEIQGYIHNCSRGIEDLSGTATNLEIRCLRFAGTTTKCINIVNGTRVTVYPSCVFDAPNTLGGTDCSLITHVVPDYQSGTFVPTFANLTVVNGTGGMTATGKWRKMGRQGTTCMVWVEITIAVTGTATTASTANSTTVTNLPFNVTTQACLMAVDNAISNIGLGLFYSFLTAYFPTWTARNAQIILSGWYETAD